MTDSDEEKTNKLQIYTLVRFTHRGRRKHLESIDIVPSKWLDFDSHRKKCVTKYMKPPYNEEDLELIQSLTINNADAPEDWPEFPVELKGRAKTYNEALKKIKRLEQEEHVLTLESEDSASDIQSQLTLDVQRKKLLAEAKKLKANVSESKATPGSSVIEKANSSKLQSDELLENGSEISVSFPLEPVASTSKEYSLEDFPVIAKEIFTVETVHPVHVTNVACNTNFETTVLAQLEQLNDNLASIKEKQDEMAKDIAGIKISQKALSNFLLDKTITHKTSIDLGTKYKVTIPIPTYEEFILFDEKLRSDKYFKNDIYLELKSSIDKDRVITKSITNMLKKFLTKEVAASFTAIRSSTANKNKQKFKPTEFCMLIFGTITKLRTERGVDTVPADLDTGLTDVFSNVSKWKNL